MRTDVLSIYGNGIVSATPTVTCITIKFDDVLKTYKEALQKSVQDSKEIKNVFINLGFDSKDLKTTQFDIRTKYEDEYVSNRRKSIFAGYQYNQQLKIKFQNDNKLLSKVLAKLSNCISNPKFTISYEIENKEELRNKAITEAVKDAISKANVIAAAAGITLDSITEINYDEDKNSYRIESVCCNKMFNASMDYDEEDYNVDFNPEDLIIKERVFISYSIK